MTTDDLDLLYSDEEIREFIEDAVARKGTQNRPRFYAITGSHIYGFESAESDIDVRGLHVVPPAEYAYLNTPANEVTINMDGTTDGFEEYAEVDLRSYELKQFGVLLAKANYNVLELVFGAPTVMNGMPLRWASTRSVASPPTNGMWDTIKRGESCCSIKASRHSPGSSSGVMNIFSSTGQFRISETMAAVCRALT